MAQVVGYFTDDVVFEEGPFIVVWANGYRIEAELKGHHCSVLADHTIYEFLELHGYVPYKTNNLEEAKEKVDFLNRMVLEKEIVQVNGIWKAI